MACRCPVTNLTTLRSAGDNGAVEGMGRGMDRHDGRSRPEAEERRSTDEQALELHARGRPGKLEIAPTKPLATARDLSLAYSPGVAAPCLAIQRDPVRAFDYTARGN